MLANTLTRSCSLLKLSLQRQQTNYKIFTKSFLGGPDIQTFNQSPVQPLSLKLSLNKHTDTEMTSEDHCALSYGLPGPDLQHINCCRQVKTTKSISSTDHLNIMNNPCSWQIRSFQYQDFRIKYMYLYNVMHEHWTCDATEN